MSLTAGQLRNEVNSANRRQHEVEFQIERSMKLILELQRLFEKAEMEGDVPNASLSIRLSTSNKDFNISAPLNMLSEVNVQQLTCILEALHDQYSDENKKLVEAMEVFRKLVK